MKSNINKVQLNATNLGISKILVSSRKNKKYMVVINNKVVHFGDTNYEDFTYHGDKNKQRLFKTRNDKWKNSPKNSPAYLAYYLLWN